MDKDSSISWNSGPVFCGAHDIKSQALYLKEHLAALLLDGQAPLVGEGPIRKAILKVKM